MYVHTNNSYSNYSFKCVNTTHILRFVVIISTEELGQLYPKTRVVTNCQTNPVIAIKNKDISR